MFIIHKCFYVCLYLCLKVCYFIISLNSYLLNVVSIGYFKCLLGVFFGLVLDFIS